MGCRQSRNDTEIACEHVKAAMKGLVISGNDGNANTKGPLKHQNEKNQRGQHDTKDVVPEIDCRGLELKALKAESLRNEVNSAENNVERALEAIRMGIVKFVGYGAHDPACPSRELCSEGVRFSLEAHRLLMLSGMQSDRCAPLLMVGSKVLRNKGVRSAMASDVVAKMEDILLDAMYWKQDRVEALEAEIAAVFRDKSVLTCDLIPQYSLCPPLFSANILA
jgi:hypothetical protein